MSWDLCFTLISLLVIPAWALLIFQPKSPITKTLVHSMLWPTLLGTFYTALIIPSMFFGQAHPDAGFSFTGLQAFFDHPFGVLTGWSHYLVFDLFVAAWISRDAQRLEISHLKTVPCLIAASFIGPTGLLIYAIIRFISGKGYALTEDVLIEKAVK